VFGWKCLRGRGVSIINLLGFFVDYGGFARFIAVLGLWGLVWWLFGASYFFVFGV
jgi:hypothetical protein